MLTRQRGFTLIELMVVLVIAGIMLGIGVPSMRDFVASQRVKNTAFDFAAALLLARSEAVKRNTSVTLGQNGGGWQSGWSVKVGTTTLSTKDIASGVNITPKPDPATASIAYQGNGRVGSTVSFEFAAPNTKAVRCVTIGVSGVPNTTQTSCS
jgi:type IV fimbrial biogenesis protein FimT